MNVVIAQTNLPKCKLDVIPLLKTLLGFLRIKSNSLSYPARPGSNWPPIFHLTPKYTLYLYCDFGFTSRLPWWEWPDMCAPLASATHRQDSPPPTCPQFSASNQSVQNPDVIMSLFSLKSCDTCPTPRGIMSKLGCWMGAAPEMHSSWWSQVAYL